MAEPETGTERKGGAGRWTRILLILSLALNLFVIALVGGAAIRHHDGRPHGGVRDVGVGHFTDVLTAKDRAALRDAFLAAAPDFRNERRAAREDFAELAAALRADPYDPARLDRIIARQGERTAGRIELGRQLLTRRIAQMAPAERAALADRIEAKLKRGWRR